MKNTIYLFLVLLIYFTSCTNEQSKTQKLSTTIEIALSQKFTKSVWVDQSIGENGEIPDTIIIESNKSLTYIGHEPNGKELCPYSINKDTLTFISHGTINDPKDFDNEIICEYSIKTLIKGDFLTYISVDMVNQLDKSSKHFDYRDYNLKFRRIKKNAL